MKRKLAEEVRKALEAKIGDVAIITVKAILQDNGKKQIGVVVEQDGEDECSVVCIEEMLDRMWDGLITADDVADFIIIYGNGRRPYIETLDFRCCDDIEYEEVDGQMGVGFTYEMWFDVDEYFGTDTKNDDGCWINFYTWYMENGDVKAKYFIESEYGNEEHDWELNTFEKLFFLRKMEGYCMKRCGMTCKEVVEERNRENNAGDLNAIVGRRYESLDLLKNDIEVLTGRDVNVIMESESDRLEEMDFMIDYEFEPFDIHTLYYLKDNAGRYYITEV